MSELLSEVVGSATLVRGIVVVVVGIVSRTKSRQSTVNGQQMKSVVSELSCEMAEIGSPPPLLRGNGGGGGDGGIHDGGNFYNCSLRVCEICAISHRASPSIHLLDQLFIIEQMGNPVKIEGGLFVVGFRLI